MWSVSATGPARSALHRDWSTSEISLRWRWLGAKNGDAVLRAFARLRASHPSATLDIVGDHPRLDQPGVTGHGFLPRENHDAQRELDALYARATAFVLPSRFDAAGMAYLEAASAGLPVIATTEGGAPEMLGNAAIAVHPDDEDGLIEAMERLAEPTTAQHLGVETATTCRRLHMASGRAADSRQPGETRPRPSLRSMTPRLLASAALPADRLLVAYRACRARHASAPVVVSQLVRDAVCSSRAGRPSLSLPSGSASDRGALRRSPSRISGRRWSTRAHRAFPCAASRTPGPGIGNTPPRARRSSRIAAPPAAGLARSD